MIDPVRNSLILASWFFFNLQFRLPLIPLSYSSLFFNPDSATSTSFKSEFKNFPNSQQIQKFYRGNVAR
ncbi:hypothetical protein L2E82_01010 [Cichorium intybus]|uniref:Uncharacterized protein n=1 Tax=Cichorium intybus TaxID=13427 RepID=A0ACB9GXL6_CICIN|nr:hypothetical protein L2E82_01010 [Cichorium intybus]